MVFVHFLENLNINIKPWALESCREILGEISRKLGPDFKTSGLVFSRYVPCIRLINSKCYG